MSSTPTNERQLDVSELEPCEPLERTLAACAELQAGQYLRVIHRREPHPLYSLLEQQGLSHDCHHLGPEHYQILIWDPQDAVATKLVDNLIASM